MESTSQTISPVPNTFLREKHIQYIKSLDNHKQDIEYWYTSHLRLSTL